MLIAKDLTERFFLYFFRDERNKKLVLFHEKFIIRFVQDLGKSV